MNRLELSVKYAKGNGLEIAPLHFPWPVHSGISTLTYMDLFPVEDLRKQYPELNAYPLVSSHVLDDGQFCKTIETNSVDFVFSSHVIEHCPHTIESIRNWLRVVKPGGHVLMAIPEKHNSIDLNRTPTIGHHVLEEFIYPEKVEENLSDHYREYFTTVDHLSGEALEQRIQGALLTRPHVHFHCWTVDGLFSMFEAMQSLFFGFKLKEFQFVAHEVFVVLEKLDQSEIEIWR